MRRREGNRPDRRIAPAGFYASDDLAALVERSNYVGSALHKLHAADYGFIPSVNPRPSKSVCDDLRPIQSAEARELLNAGFCAGMVSRFDRGGSPKYVWAVDGSGEVYEAKTKPPDIAYHGYRLAEDDAMRSWVKSEWQKRCPKS